MVEKIVRTTCQACHCECGVLVHVENGKIMKIEGDSDFPMNRGFVCVKGEAYHEYVYHPNRVKYPMKRVGKRGEGKWERSTWNQVLNEKLPFGLKSSRRIYSDNIKAYYANGYRGNFLVIVPEHNIVAVRCADNDGFDYQTDFFPEFVNLISKLVE